jgi:hypothetical protein
MRIIKRDWQIINAALALYECEPAAGGDRVESHKDSEIAATRSKVQERLDQYNNPYED